MQPTAAAARRRARLRWLDAQDGHHGAAAAAEHLKAAIVLPAASLDSAALTASCAQSASTVTCSPTMPCREVVLHFGNAGRAMLAAQGLLSHNTDDSWQQDDSEWPRLDPEVTKSVVAQLKAMAEHVKMPARQTSLVNICLALFKCARDAGCRPSHGHTAALTARLAGGCHSAAKPPSCHLAVDVLHIFVLEWYLLREETSEDVSTLLKRIVASILRQCFPITYAVAAPEP